MFGTISSLLILLLIIIFSLVLLLSSYSSPAVDRPCIPLYVGPKPKPKATSRPLGRSISMDRESSTPKPVKAGEIVITDLCLETSVYYFHRGAVSVNASCGLQRPHRGRQVLTPPARRTTRSRRTRYADTRFLIQALLIALLGMQTAAGRGDPQSPRWQVCSIHVAHLLHHLF